MRGTYWVVALALFFASTFQGLAFCHCHNGLVVAHTHCHQEADAHVEHHCEHLTFENLVVEKQSDELLPLIINFFNATALAALPNTVLRATQMQCPVVPELTYAATWHLLLYRKTQLLC